VGKRQAGGSAPQFIDASARRCRRGCPNCARGSRCGYRAARRSSRRSQRRSALDVKLHQALGHELQHLAQHSISALFSASSVNAIVAVVIVEDSLDRLAGPTSTMSGTTMATPNGIAVAARQAASGYALRALPPRKTYITSWDINLVARQSFRGCAQIWGRRHQANPVCIQSATRVASFF